MTTDRGVAGTTAVIDVAIVGGGVSGAYTAWRLMSSKAAESPVLAELAQGSSTGRLNVRLFESSDRIGGRLWSVQMDNVPNLPAEVGGMRFLNTQLNVVGVCAPQQLNLPTANFGFADNIQYLRGQHFNDGDYATKPPLPVPGGIPYFLTSTETNKNPIQLVIAAIEQILPDAMKYKGTDLIEYLRGAVVDGVPLYEWGFWTLLRSKLSVDAYHLVQDASGYFSIYGNWSAYGAFLEFIRNYADNHYMKVVGGYQQIPLAMIERFRELGGHAQINSHLLDVQPDSVGGEPVIRLEFMLSDGTTRFTRYAHHAVLAMPQRSFQLLDPASLPLQSAAFREDIMTVTPEPASKLFLTFDEPWWTPLGITTGRSDTDLPLRQCYYIGTETAAPHTGMSLLMASYNDGMADSYWDTYLDRSAYGPNQAPYAGKHSDGTDPRLFAPHDMVIDVHGQLEEMHGIQIPLPTAAVYHNWQEDPIGAGWYFWNPHVRSWEVAPRVRRPIADLNLYTCGSCYSENQGWVEGALNTAEMMLHDCLGLPRATWLPDDYYIGP
ncbi:MAG: FAD-dependent oxidoreductase [Actinomycetota bacterium]